MGLEYYQSEQWVLFKMFDNLLHYHKDDTFDKVIQLMTPEPELIFNRVFACKPEVAGFYLNLTPLQKSYLQPQLRLYRVDKATGKDIEITFNSHFDSVEFHNLTHNQSEWNFNNGESKKLDGSAIKSITISEQPERPSDVNINCKIDLYFDNIIGFTNSNVLELITSPVRKVKFDAKDYRIKLVIGWNVPTDTSQLNFTAKEKEIITKSNVVYLLELVRHNINLRDNGAVDISIEYAGALESTLSNQPYFDILNFQEILNDPWFNLSILKNTKIVDWEDSPDAFDVNMYDPNEETIRAYSSNLNQISNKEAENNMDLLTAKIKYINLTITKSTLEAKLEKIVEKQNAIPLNSNKKNPYEKETDDINQKIKEIDTQLADLKMIILIPKYQQILESIRQKARLFRVDIPKDIFIQLGSAEGKFLLSSDEIFDKLKSATPRPIRSDVTGENSLDVMRRMFNITGSIENSIEIERERREKDYLDSQYYRIQQQGQNFLSVRKLSEMEDVETDSDEERFKEFLTEPFGKNKRELGNTQRELEKTFPRAKHSKLLELAKVIVKYESQLEDYPIQYILLGDLINTVLSIVNSQAVNIVLGPLRYGDRIINLAQLPISIQHFSNWFTENVIKQVKETYYLWDFIQDVVNSLIVPQMIENNFSSEGFPNLNITMTTVLSNKPLEKGLIYSDVELSNYISRGYKIGEEVFPYLVIYSKVLNYPNRSADPIKDSKDGIYHFAIGKNKGVIKGINFSKIDFPKLRDARLTGDELNRAGKVLREAYNCKLTAIGNPLFIPGVLFYFDGSYLGANGKNVTQVLGMGGYYMVTNVSYTFNPGKYDIEVQGMFQFLSSPTPEAVAIVDSLKFVSSNIVKIDNAISKTANGVIKPLGTAIMNSFKSGLKQ